MHTIILGGMLPTIRIESNGVPIYVQIRDQLLLAIGRGALRAGDQLPTMRQMAVTLKIDLNTVRHAYDELETTGAIVIIRARGTYVAQSPPTLDVARQAKKVTDLAHQLIAQANAAGLDPIDVAQQIIEFSKRQGVKK